MRAQLSTWILLAALAGCSRSGPTELMETAKFEEVQQNIPHARELYQKIVTEYPDSAEAKIARERLTALDQPAPDKPTPQS